MMEYERIVESLISSSEQVSPLKCRIERQQTGKKSITALCSYKQLNVSINNRDMYRNEAERWAGIDTWADSHTRTHADTNVAIMTL